MLDELARSRQQLVHANLQLDQRREFTEAVLGGVSSGVIGLDAEGKVTLPNASARALLDKTNQELIGYSFVDIVPEFSGLMSATNEAMTSLKLRLPLCAIPDARFCVRGSLPNELKANYWFCRDI